MVILDSELDVILLTEKIKNKTIKEIIALSKNNDINVWNKGHVGHVIESYFGITKNNKPEPDLVNLRIEIKSTPLKLLKDKSTISIKERMVLNSINFNKEKLNNFNDSSFFIKNKKILMIFYLYDEDKKDKNYIVHSFIYHKLLEIPSEDLEVIKNDWMIIAQKIKDGKAHELSERLTKFLGACPKGVNKKSLTTQPFSDILAMRRAYAFKPQYLKYLFLRNEYNWMIEKLVGDNNRNINVFELIFNKIKPYVKISSKKLCHKFGISLKSKNKHHLILLKIFGVKNFNLVDELVRENIQIRTYTFDLNYKIQEEFPFMPVSNDEFTNKTFYDSELYNFFENIKIIFIGFQKGKNGETYIRKMNFFEFPEKNMKDLKNLWEDTAQKFQNGIEFYFHKNKKCNNLISKSNNKIGHIRPKARNKAKTYITPYGQEITKQCYWLNKEFVQENFVDLSDIFKGKGNKSGR